MALKHPHVFLCIVPIDGNAAVQCATPIFRDGVLLLQSVEEVEGIFFANILDPEVVHN